MSSAEPFLVFRRTGKTIAKVIAFGFGGGTLIMGLATSFASALQAGALFVAFRAYFLAALPFFAGGAVLALCWRELWVVPAEGGEGRGVLRMLTYRPWMLHGPRVEQARLEDYASVCAARLNHRAEKSSYAVVLTTREGDKVPVRDFDRVDEAHSFVEKLAQATGLPIESAELTADG